MKKSLAQSLTFAILFVPSRQIAARTAKAG
jgi:hypothetical protein